MTNADKIRSMTDEELHEFISIVECGDLHYEVTFCDLCKKDGNTMNFDCADCLEFWLESDTDAYNGINSLPDF